MAINHSSKPSNIRPYKLSSEEHEAIGRMIRACAEIEDIIDLYLGSLAKLGQGQILLLLGRSSASSKLQIAKSLAYTMGGDTRVAYDECFEQEVYFEIIRCRNSVAHGQLLGLTDDDEIAFQVKEQIGMTETAVHVAVNAYEHNAFAIFARAAESVIPEIEERLGLGALREKRRLQPLDPRGVSTTPKRRKRRKLRSDASEK